MANFSNSSTVAAGDTVLATQYNNVRKDTVINAGDYNTSGGSSNAFTLTLDSQITAYVTGMVVKFKANFDNTATPTLNINTLGAKSIKKNISEDLAPFDIRNGQLIIVMYDGTNFQLISDGNLDQPYGNFVAGETIDASSEPKAVYLKLSDQKIYKTSASTAAEALFKFVGFVVYPQSVVANDAVKVQLGGVVKNFSSLSAATYHISNTAGAISATPGTISFQIGVAKSSTELLMQRGIRVVVGSLSFNSTTTQTITVGFRVSKILFFAVKSSNDFSNSVWTPSTAYGVGISSSSAGYTGAWSVGTGGTSHTGAVSNITETSFDVTNTKTGAPADVDIVYIAEG